MHKLTTITSRTVTMQTMYALVSGQTFRRDMPPAGAILNSGISWGRFDELFTAAYWCGQAWQAGLLGLYKRINLGRSLAEETAACLLGGYGMPAEIGLAAFERLRSNGLLTAGSSAEELERSLSEPFEINGHCSRYRFPRQKAKYLAVCLDQVEKIDETALDDAGLRSALTGLPGVGYKTASWIVRNRRNSSRVAVLDVHILRAGRLMGLFEGSQSPQRDYLVLEARFVEFAKEIDVPAWLLDAVMWQHMRLLRNA
ncbi:conserved protein of unknown function [Bradyrhizobium sp. ORS 285]|uniref:8-oxoguanine DNA glycosylase n=1 Tax=Bradyrhizobium sp. ORS 285 TaxID=115808 RepID=UPI00024094C7|nr:hypothetical protein [Bradyrhizobium sp. ORS 285]CCD86334.1 conserved hypothetical protein [Bradyrhizobium sp. ORS 285]SMX56132.1 conserved protein of unknown function [Bradyrhizobium sp. ORS 285]